MGFKEVASLDADSVIPLGGFNKKTRKDNQTSAEGYFLGTRIVDSTKSKDGKSCIHFLQTSRGNLGIWGKTDMDKKLKGVAPGTMIRITHTGMRKVPTGEMYVYKVEIDTENTIEVNTGNADNNFEASDSDTADGGGYDSNDTVDQDDDADDTQDADDTPPPQQQSAAERQAKVQALLKGKGNTKRA